MISAIKAPVILSLVGRALGICAGIYIAYSLGPENFAFFALWIIIIEYLAYFNLGLGNAIFRNISISEDINDTEQIQNIIDIGVTTLLMSALIGIIVLFVSYFYQLLPIQMSNLEFCLLVIARLIDIWFGVTKSIAKGLGLMISQAWVEGGLAIVVPLLNVVAVTFFGILGLMIVHILVSLIGIMILRLHKIRLTFSLLFDYGLIKKMLKISLPLFSANLLEATMITLPIMLSGYVIEGFALGGFLYFFQNSRPEKIPLYSYFTIINFRFLLIEASKNAKLGAADTWERVELNLKTYFMLTAIGTACIFAALNYFSRFFLQEYVGSLSLLLLTLPCFSFFSLRRIFNAYFTAVNKLTKRLLIYLICLLLSLCFFGYAKPLGVINANVLALWLSTLMLISSTLGFVAFLKDIGHTGKYIWKQLISISFSLLLSYFCMKVLLYFSEWVVLDTWQGATLFAFVSLLYVLFYAILLLCITALLNNKSPAIYLKRLVSSETFTNKI